jgi:putrescine---pyruvate transaminase
MTTADTLRWRQLDARHHLHPFTDHAELAARGSRIITRAEGCWLWDSEGNRLLDGMAGLWCVNVGYGRPEIAEAARQAIENLNYYHIFGGSSNEPIIRPGWSSQLKM